MAVDVVIFDCDGVLIDSEVVVCGIVADELSKHGYPISIKEVLERYAGRPEHEMRAEIEASTGRAIPDTYRSNSKARIFEAYGAGLQLVPGILEALGKITLPVCVASSSFPEKLQLGLETVGLYERFAPNVISGTLVAHGKPSPDIFVFAAGWMRTSPMRCLVVEDSLPGLKAAKSAGMQVFGFAGGAHCGPNHAEKLAQAGAAAVFSDMRELPSLIAAAARAS